MSTQTAFRLLSYHFRPDSLLHTLAGAIIMAALVLLLPFLFAIR